ncbi:MAG: hypothetical protein COC24_015015 [Alphaproteobacteria bacterium]|nr:hypothetical protein [Alphaproteobacteria bacterium]
MHDGCCAPELTQLEQSCVDLLRTAQAAENMDADGEMHDAFDIAYNGKCHHVDSKR